MMRTGLLVGAVAVLATTASANYSEGVAAMQRGDMPAAMDAFRADAQNGDVRAQKVLGVLYTNGQGVEADPAEAAKWYTLAAAQGDENSINMLGILYDRGLGVKQDRILAYALFSLVADRYVFAQSALAQIDQRLSESNRVAANQLHEELSRDGQFLTALNNHVSGKPKLQAETEIPTQQRKPSLWERLTRGS